jgi:two-component system, response regulator
MSSAGAGLFRSKEPGKGSCSGHHLQNCFVTVAHMQKSDSDASCSDPALYRIVAVDDSEDDLFFLDWAIKRNPRFTCLALLSSGNEALSYFRREPPFDDMEQYPEPNLVVLDLKMPGVDGFSVLKFLQENVPSRKFRVLVLTSSSSPDDEQRSKELGAELFETKPTMTGGYALLLQRIASFMDG